MKRLVLFTCYFACSGSLYSQDIKFDKNILESVNDVSMSIENLTGKEVLKVIKDSTITEVDEPTFIKLKELNLKTVL